MSLPKIDLPIYECKLYSKEQPIKFRPFTVKEKKILLMALEANDMDSCISGLKQVINNCVLEEIDVDNLPMVDMELLFLQLKARSEGEITTAHYTCQNEVPIKDANGFDTVNTKPCGMVIPVNVNLLEVGLDRPWSGASKIMFTDHSGVQMKLQTFELLKQISDAKDEDAEAMTVLNAIDYAFDNNKGEIYKLKDAEPEERLTWIGELPLDKYEEMKDFLKNAPTIKKEVKKTCPKCNFDHDIILEGLQDFF